MRKKYYLNIILNKYSINKRGKTLVSDAENRKKIRKCQLQPACTYEREKTEGAEKTKHGADWQDCWVTSVSCIVLILSTVGSLGHKRLVNCPDP
jgi:hypothetical protein